MEVNRLTTLQLGCKYNIEYHIVACQGKLLKNFNRAPDTRSLESEDQLQLASIVRRSARWLEFDADPVVLVPYDSGAPL